LELIVSPDNHVARNIGSIVTNLQSLEFALRLFLDETQGYSDSPKDIPVNLTGLNVGEWVPENYFTNYDTLRQLIRKVNSELQKRSLSERIDESLVELRDAIAHGRVLSLNPDGPFRIIKFSKPIDHKTQVKISVDMTSEWLSQQTKRTHDEIMKVVRIGQSLGLKCFPKD
jgi:hypothetical protein